MDGQPFSPKSGKMPSRKLQAISVLIVDDLRLCLAESCSAELPMYKGGKAMKTILRALSWKVGEERLAQIQHGQDISRHCALLMSF